MKRLTGMFLALAVFAIAVPLSAQEGNLAYGYFVTADDADAPALEEGMRQHAAWHGEQGDTWTWVVYQAMTGGIPEYVWVSPGHMWADFDNPVIDEAADIVNWAKTGAPHSTTVTGTMWSTWTDVSRPPPAGEIVPIYEVLEFDLNATTEGREALLHTFGKIKDAMDAQNVPFQYTVNEVESSDEPPSLFVAIAHASFAELDGGDPNGLQALLLQAYGHAETAHLMRTLESNLSPISRRFWAFREDLSYMPEQQ
jgi:hypothetical protein